MRIILFENYLSLKGLCIGLFLWAIGMLLTMTEKTGVILHLLKS